MLTDLIKSINDVSMESSINVCDAIVGMIDKNELVKEYDNECVFGDVIMESMMVFMESKNRERDRTPRNEIAKWMEKNNLWYTGSNPSKKKLSNRIYHFLQQHDFNPADGTYKTDIKLKDGTYKRLKLNIEINGRIPLTQKEKHIFKQWKDFFLVTYDGSFYFFEWDKILRYAQSEEEMDLYYKLKSVGDMAGGKNAFYESSGDEIYLSVDTLKSKQSVSQSILKHEEGHAYDIQDNDKSKQDLEEINKIKTDSGKHWNDAVEKGMRGNNHDEKPTESYADAYSVKHTKIRTKNNSTRNISNEELLKHFQKLDQSLEKTESITIDRCIHDIENSIENCNTILEDTSITGEAFRNYVSLSGRVKNIGKSVKRINERQKKVDMELSILDKTDDELMKLKKELERKLETIIGDDDYFQELYTQLDLVEDFLDGFRPKDVDKHKETLQKSLQMTKDKEKSYLKELSNKPLGGAGYKAASQGGRINLCLSNKDIDEIVSKAKTKEEAEVMILNKLKPVIKRIKDKLMKAKSNLEEIKKTDIKIKDVSTRVRYEFAKKFVKEYFESLLSDCGLYMEAETDNLTEDQQGMNVLKATPLVEVNGVKFGMNRQDVRNIFGEPTEFKKSRFIKTTSDDFGFCHVFYNQDDECMAIEIFDGTEVQIDNITVFPNGMDKLRSMLPDIEEDDCGFISRSKSIGVYAPNGKMESILFGCTGYYD